MFKKAFTLFELIIVIVLVGIIYYLTISNFSLKQQKVDTLSLVNLKEKLSTFDFEEKVSLQCTDTDNIECLIVVDNVIQEEKVTELFQRCPDVYEYSKELKRKEFYPLNVNDNDKISICFRFDLLRDGHSSQMIVELDNKVLIYDNISKQPHKIDYLNDIGDYFENKISEVKDAF